MKTKTVRQYIDRGFGFPVILENVRMLRVRGVWTPHLNYQRLARKVLRQLIGLDGRLSGNQLRFVRQHFEMTLQSFAARFDVTHPAVLKWERAGDKPTEMNWGTEKDIRLFIAKALTGTPEDFFALYVRLETVRPRRSGRISLDAERMAA